ncbi:hypothetical protein UPYG_G00078070 [Umbra pygmaea]|uniref:Uncharacterized protein n=1 Tax=Umbra pygmaea TaxID=75934 RepID=A0ABD0XD41_UMBPY
MSKSCLELLREAAHLIEEALSRTPAAQSQQIPAANHDTPVQGHPCRNQKENKREAKVKKNYSETALVSDSVPVRPGTSAESAVVPAVIVNEELDRKEIDSEWKHIKEPTQAAKVFKENLLREHATGKPLRMKWM